MFGSNYYCLVAGLREYTLEADAKGFDARAIVSEILEGVSRADARQVRLLYTYYDCEHLAALHAGRTVSEGLGNLTPDELAEELRSPRLLPDAVQQVLRAYADPEGEEAAEIDTAQRFEKALFGAYYAVCEKQGCRFLRAWSAFDRTLRNVAAAVTARAAGRPVEEVAVGGGDVVHLLGGVVQLLAGVGQLRFGAGLLFRKLGPAGVVIGPAFVQLGAGGFPRGCGGAEGGGRLGGGGV